MSAETPTERLRENPTGVVALLVTGIALTGLFTGQSWWLVVMIVGYAVVVPLTAVLFGDETAAMDWADRGSHESASERANESEDDEDPLETLRQRYARGDLTEEQFERKLERLLETETREDAAEHARSRPDGRVEDDGREREREFE